MKKLIYLAVGPFRFVIQRIGKRYQIRYKFNKKHLVADLVLFFGVVFLIIFNLYISLIFTKWVISLQVKLDVEISQPVKSGEETRITVNYFNSAKKAVLEEVELSLVLPDNFKVKEVSDGRYDAQTDSLNIGELAAQAGGKLELIGETWGDYGAEQKILARLDYWQQSMVDQRVKWRDQRIDREKYQISGSIIDCQVSAPTLVANNSTFDFQINCQNNYSQTLADLKLKLIPRDEFDLISSQPALINNFFYLGELEAGESANLTAEGKFNFTQEERNTQLNLELYGSHDQVFLLDKIEPKIEIFYPHFQIGSLINDQASYSPILGEELEYTLTYKNLEAQKVEGLEISVDLTSPFYQLATIGSDSNFCLEERHLFFNDLGDLAPQQEGEIKFKIKTTKKISNYSRSPADLKLIPWAHYSLNYQGQDLKVDSEQPPVSSLLSSNLELSAFGRYYTLEGEQLGVGPLPPVVGIPTKYRIFWQVNNSFNQVADITVSGILPNNVVWTGQESVNAGSSLDFNPKTRQLSWSIKSLDSFTGFNSLPASANFSLEITPLASQVNEIAILLQDIKITGQDMITGRKLERFKNHITTNLPNDQRASGQGVVLAY